MEGPSQKIFNNGGWLCLTDAQRYYTTLQFWQVTGSADGVYPIFLGKRYLNQDFRDLWIDRMPGDGPIPIRWEETHRLKRHTAVAK